MDEILLEAKVLAVADVVEAMSSHRPYRPALELEAAIKEVESGSGTLYDPEVCDACLRLFRERGYVLETVTLRGLKGSTRAQRLFDQISKSTL